MNEAIKIRSDEFEDLTGAMAIYYYLSSWKDTTNAERRKSMWKAQQFFSEYVNKFYTGKIPEKEAHPIIDI
jgi:hypothetical protein